MTVWTVYSVYEFLATCKTILVVGFECDQDLGEANQSLIWTCFVLTFCLLELLLSIYPTIINIDSFFLVSNLREAGFSETQTDVKTNKLLNK